jgi:uncharacterized protein (DUF1501 family)
MPQPSNFVAAQAAMTAAAAAPENTGRKNLIVVFLNGGSDGHNTVIPRAGANRTHYNAYRPSIGIADNPATALDANWCLHPALAPIHSLWSGGDLAIVRNVGPLIQPITRAQYLDAVTNPATALLLPAQLYSHSDQQRLWRTGIADQPSSPTGWLGRLAELLIPFNSGATVASMLSTAGQTDIFKAFDLRALALSTNGLPSRNGGGQIPASMQTLINNRLMNDAEANPLAQEVLNAHRRADAATNIINQARDARPAPAVVFPNTFLGSQLRIAVRLAASQDVLQQRRTIFYAQHGGYDHHADQVNQETGRFSELAPALAATYTALQQLGIAGQTTILVISEFSRSMQQNGSGTDHGWGGHAFLIGNAVVGGYYGQPYSYDPSGPDMVLSQGHMIPTTSTDTLIASLGRWMGVPDATANGVNPLNLLCPNLPNFPTRTLAGMLA